MTEQPQLDFKVPASGALSLLLQDVLYVTSERTDLLHKSMEVKIQKALADSVNRMLLSQDTYKGLSPLSEYVTSIHCQPDHKLLIIITCILNQGRKFCFQVLKV